MHGPDREMETVRPNSAPPAGRVRTLAVVFLLMLLGSSGYEVLKALLLPPLPFWQSQAITFVSGSALAAAIAARVLRDAERQEERRRQIETGLHAQEQQYRMVFENATHGIYRTTPAGQILLANPAPASNAGL